MNLEILSAIFGPFPTVILVGVAAFGCFELICYLIEERNYCEKLMKQFRKLYKKER